jgi:hypothetical protein
MHVSGIKIPRKKSHPYTYIHTYIHTYIQTYNIKFLALLGAPYIFNISRLRVNNVDGADTCIGGPVLE